jgi:hypothetical protein
MLIDYATVIGRAAWVRHQAGYIGEKPPYSSRHLIETVFPKIAVTGADLPKGVTEMAITKGRQRALYYNRKVPHSAQRVGLIHGIYHHLSDIKAEPGLRECNLQLRELAHHVERLRDPVELACDLFAAEVLVPLDVLHPLAPENIYPRDPIARQAVEDETDHLSSMFNVPRGFMKWRLYDLHALRRSHFMLGR